MPINREDWERLKEIRQEILNLTNEAADIVRRADRNEYERSRAYWIGHVHCAMGGEENQYVSAGHDSLYDTRFRRGHGTHGVG